MFYIYFILWLNYSKINILYYKSGFTSQSHFNEWKLRKSCNINYHFFVKYLNISLSFIFCKKNKNWATSNKEDLQIYCLKILN